MNKKYGITIICGTNPYKGPGIIALDMMRGFLEDGHRVKILANAEFETEDTNVISISKFKRTNSSLLKRKLISFYKRCLRYLNKSIPAPSKYNMYSLEEQNKSKYSKAVLTHLFVKPDVIIYLFSHDFLTPVDLKIIYAKASAPILFWLMDCAAMTGGCHFTWECTRYMQNCGKCPGINSLDERDLTNENMLLKHEIFNQIEIYAVYGGERMKQMLVHSSLFKDKKIFRASPPVDKTYYSNIFRKESRIQFNFPGSQKLIFIAANQLSSERKGMRLLLNALQLLDNKLTVDERDKTLLVIAGNNIMAIENDIPFQYRYLGYLSHTDFAKVMRSACLFICPSTEDYGPMVINQSLMCGTPVVAFDMGVASEIVHTGVTGYRARLGDVEDLAIGIKYILNLNAGMWQEMSDNCRSLALKDFSVEKVRDNFYSIFEEVLRSRNECK